MTTDAAKVADQELLLLKSRRKNLAEAITIPEFTISVRTGPGAFRFKILDSAGQARSLRVHAVITWCAANAASFVEELEGDGQLEVKFNAEHRADPLAALVWIYCEDAITGDRLVFQKEDGDAPMLKVNAYRGDNIQNIVPLAAVGDALEHTANITVPD